MDTEGKEAMLAAALSNPRYSHAENILVALREHESRGTPHHKIVDDLFTRFIQA